MAEEVRRPRHGMTADQADAGAFFVQLPKVDLHRHLEGSLRLDTMLELAADAGLDLPFTHPTLQPRVRMQADEVWNWENFLAKFDTLRRFYRSPDIIRRITREAIADAAADNIVYLELRFTPATLARSRGFALADVFDWVEQAAAEAAAEHGIRVRLIASVNRHDPVAEAEQVARIAGERRDGLVVGLDLAGNEVEFPAQPFEGVFREARQAGLRITVHAGEWTGAASVRHALETMHADRIAHGVRVMEDPAVVALAVERRTPFEVCLTSNLHSGVVAALPDHPLPRMILAGLQVSLSTDDPSISDIRLSDEYALAVDQLGLSDISLAGLILAAGQAAFLPDREKRLLEAELQSALLTRA
jgi:adenosine deaminase